MKMIIVNTLKWNNEKMKLGTFYEWLVSFADEIISHVDEELIADSK